MPDGQESSASSDATAQVFPDPTAVDDLEDWGPVPEMIEGQSYTAGKVLYKGPEGRSECGIWTCTPGHWECKVTRDEFCQFLLGRATYAHEDGDVIEIEPETTVFFPEGWTGTCHVHETVRKVYMCR